MLTSVCDIPDDHVLLHALKISKEHLGNKKKNTYGDWEECKILNLFTS